MYYQEASEKAAGPRVFLGMTHLYLHIVFPPGEPHIGEASVVLGRCVLQKELLDNDNCR